MENKIIKTFMLNCDIAFTLPANFEDLDKSKQLEILLNLMAENKFEFERISYPDEMEEIIAGN
jgi:hypothetical protein